MVVADGRVGAMTPMTVPSHPPSLTAAKGEGTKGRSYPPRKQVAARATAGACGQTWVTLRACVGNNWCGGTTGGG